MQTIKDGNNVQEVTPALLDAAVSKKPFAIAIYKNPLTINKIDGVELTRVKLDSIVGSCKICTSDKDGKEYIFSADFEIELNNAEVTSVKFNKIKE